MTMCDTIGLYVHVPFCGRKCPYCDFFSQNFTKELGDSFTQAVVRDVENFDKGILADTVYFGGGTPSMLPTANIRDILKALSAKFLLKDPEITIEINPSTVTEKKAFGI